MESGNGSWESGIVSLSTLKRSLKRAHASGLTRDTAVPYWSTMENERRFPHKYRPAIDITPVVRGPLPLTDHLVFSAINYSLENMPVPHQYGDNELVVNYNDAVIYGKDLAWLESNTAWLNDACIHYQLTRLQQTRDPSAQAIISFDPAVVSFLMHQVEDDDEIRDFTAGYHNFESTKNILFPSMTIWGGSTGRHRGSGANGACFWCFYYQCRHRRHRRLQQYKEPRLRCFSISSP
jgi:hypothetical protein